ncbi:MAG: precorrin-2 C(20)-methyltransferase [Negativicutes bacterium]|nr:precorrin-2 C(20)-methyltransferase [Negativicutes bacterium]
MKGTFYGVGVGPGDPELLTLKAVHAIQRADVLIAPKTEKKEESTALAIARPHIREGTAILDLVFPMVYSAHTLSSAWEANRDIICELLAQGKQVVFLTLGDPMLYSTYIYVYNLLKDRGFSIETIPGITSFCAIGSRLGYPLAEGNDVLSIIPATADDAVLDKALAGSDSVVLLKVNRNFDQLLAKLDRSGLLTTAVMVTKCGHADEEIVTDIRAAGGQKVNYLSAIVARRPKA